MESENLEMVSGTEKESHDAANSLADESVEENSTKLTLAVTSDEDSRESSKEPNLERDIKPDPLPIQQAAIAAVNHKFTTTLAQGGALKRKKSAVELSSDEEDFAGFDECNGGPEHNPFKKIKEEITSEGEQETERQIIIEGNSDLTSTIKAETSESGDENKPPDTAMLMPEEKLNEKSELEDKPANISSALKQRSIKDPIYRKPFALGWKREVVYRAIPDASKDKGEVYYITPMGKKIRTRTEIQLHMPPDLTLENFTFAREPIGMGPDEEMIRNAKPTARSTPTDVPLGKRIPKPKGPKGASPPPQGWTPVRAVKSSGPASSPRPVSSIRTSEDGESKISIAAKSTTKSNKSQKKGEPCTIECVLAMGMIPQLQCTKCLCLYHHECIGLDRSDGRLNNGTNSGGSNSGSKKNAEGYICEYCKHKSPAALQPSQKSVTQSPPKSQATTATMQTSSTVGLSQIQRRGNDTIKDSCKPQQTAPVLSNKPSSNNSRKNSTQETGANLPQTIAVIKGRKYVVIRKPTVPYQDSHTNEPTNESSITNPSSLSLTTGEDTLVRKRGTITRTSKSENQQVIDSNNQSVQRQSNLLVSSDNFATHFFSNVSIGYHILLQTFQYLKVQELLRAACVCRVWNVVANHRSLWETVRMKNSQVNNWTGLAAALKRNETKHLDLRKMISSTNGEEMWASFSKNIKEVESLETIDLCRCSSRIVEGLFLSNPQLRVINAVAIKDDIFSLENIDNLKNLQELRLKSIDGFSLDSDLHALKMLKNLKHLSLTSIREFGTKDILVLSELVCLESLELGECNDLGIVFATEVLTKLTNLERLRLEKGQETCCTLEILEAVSKLEKLNQLELVNFDIKNGFDEKLSKCKNIRRLLLIPTYISQSATTNNIVLSAVLELSETLQILTWAVTLELLRVTALYVDQCDNKKKDKKFFDESIPVLKPVPGILDDIEKAQKSTSDVPQVEILPLVRVEKILVTGMPNTKFKILKVPYHATWRQNLVDIP